MQKEKSNHKKKNLKELGEKNFKMCNFITLSSCCLSYISSRLSLSIVVDKISVLDQYNKCMFCDRFQHKRCVTFTWTKIFYHCDSLYICWTMFQCCFWWSCSRCDSSLPKYCPGWTKWARCTLPIIKVGVQLSISLHTHFGLILTQTLQTNFYRHTSYICFINQYGKTQPTFLCLLHFGNLQ